MIGPTRGTVLVVVAFAAAFSGCGGDEGAETGTPQGKVHTAQPPDRQMLAFAGPRHVGVVDGDEVKILGRSSAPGQELADIQWSADGRQIGWLTRNSEYRYTLRMFDVASGRERRWKADGTSLAPSLTGLTLAGRDGTFVEYLPGGTTITRRIEVPPGQRERRLAREHDIKWVTSVLLATPREGRWLIAAQLTGMNTELGPTMRLYHRDAAASAVEPADDRRYSTPAYGLAVASDGGRPAWAVSPMSTTEGAGDCDGASDFVQRADGALPKLPDAGSWRWRIRQVSSSGNRVDVIAARVRSGAEYMCEADPSGPVWLRWMNRRWDIVGEHVMSAAEATDGRRARVEGRSSGEHYPGLAPYAKASSAYLSDGERKFALPRDTMTVRFSPHAKTSLAIARGRGPALTPESRLSEDGFGPWRFGMTGSQLQASTVTPLRFDVGETGCGTVAVEDDVAHRKLGVQGHLVDGRLERVTVTSHDVPPVEPDETGTDLQPGVRQVKARGPRLGGRVRAGDGAQGLFALFGPPVSVRANGILGAAEHSYRTGNDSLVRARVDAAGQIRHLDVGTGERC